MAAGAGKGGEAAIEAGEHPVGVDAGMPVKAAVEDWVQGARALCVGNAGEDVVQLVGVFAGHMAEGDGGETIRQVLGELGHWIASVVV